MPIISNKGQYQSTYPPVRRRRRRRKPILPVILAVLVAVGVGVSVWAFWPKDSGQDAKPPVSNEAQVLELPEAVQIQPVILADQTQPKAQDHVIGLDGTGIAVAYKKTPGNGLGEQTVTLEFSKNGAVCTREASVYRFHLEQSVAVPAGGEKLAGIRDFISDETVEASFVGKQPQELDHSAPGMVTLTITCGGREYEVTYDIQDCTAPTATTKEVTIEAGAKVEPGSFIDKITDQTEVTVTFAKEPELTIIGSHSVELLLTDAYGNTSAVKSAVHVKPAKDAPVISGLTDMKILAGNTISYKTGVKATDPQDGEVTFTVDASGVKRDKSGTYYAYYTAKDSDGNTTTYARKILVESIDRETVERYARAALDEIITPDMTRDQQIFAIYKYTKSHVTFVGTSDKTDIAHGAYEGFTTGKGDCYTYYAMNVVFFDLLGIENLEVTRINGTSHHWWNLVLHEDGKYYHVDSCPVRYTVDGIAHWKMTDTDLQTYTKGVAWYRENFYTYDKTLPEYQQIDIAP